MSSTSPLVGEIARARQIVQQSKALCERAAGLIARSRETMDRVEGALTRPVLHGTDDEDRLIVLPRD